MITEDIRTELYSLADVKYRDFQAKLIPGLEKEMIGVRNPQMRALAKKYAKEPAVGKFLEELPHRYFDEDQLHAFIISLTKDLDICISQVEAFLPYVTNWATCDQLSPKCFAKNKEKLLPYIKKWIAGTETYTIRFGIGMLMQHYLDRDFDPSYPEFVAKVDSNEYYVNMMKAWYFATALAKQWDAVIPFIEQRRLDAWSHSKTIQKSIESYRITTEQKDYLRTLKCI